MKQLARYLALVTGTVFLSAPAPAAPDPAAAPALSPNDRLLQQELKQQQIRTTTQRVADQLAAVIAEFDRNQIVGEDVRALRAVSRVLGLLSEKDMQLVITYLQEAREAADPSASAQRATEAFARQKAIILQLQQLLAEYERQHQLYLLAVRFRELARRQTEIMRSGVLLADKTSGKTLNSFNEEEKNALRLQQIEHDTLKPEVQLRAGELEKLTREFTDGPTAERPRAALRQLREGPLLPALEEAAADLLKGLVLKAAGNQRRARNELREISRLLLLSEDPTHVLRQALHEVEEALDQQRTVIDTTRRLDTREAAAATEKKQAEVVDFTDLIRRDVEGLAPVAAEHLRKAYEAMTDARDALLPRDKPDTRPAARRDKALPFQEHALTALEQSRRALQEQLLRAEQLAAQPDRSLAALRDLQEQVRALIAQESQLKEQTAAAPKNDLPTLAPRQGEIKDQTQAAEERAAPAAPAAAEALRAAAQHMQKAQTSLADAKNSPETQQAAIDALQQADRQLEQQIAQLQQAEQDLARLDALSAKLQGLISRQQQTQFDTATAAASQDPSRMKALAGAQQQLRQDTGALKQEVADPVPAAAPHLEQAAQHMAVAKTELDKPSAQTAQPAQSEALTDLYAAKKEIDRQADALRQLLGQPVGSDAQSLADAQSAIEQAQQQVSEALANLQQGQPPGLLEALQQRQQQIADALEPQARGTPPTTRLAQAHQAASQAAQQLARRDLPQAIAAMRTAQEAMQAAPATESANARQEPGQPPLAQPESALSPPTQATSPNSPAQPQTSPPAPSLPQLTQAQAEVKKDAEALLAAMQATPAPANRQAAQHLQQAGQTVGPLTAGQMGALPLAAHLALQTAEQALAQGTAQASASQNPPAQASAASAQQALSQAQAALALAQAGMNAQPGQGQPGQSQQAQGQGQQPGPGKGQGQTQQPGQGQPSPRGDGRVGNWSGTGGTQGPRQSTEGTSGFLGLPKRDRAALMQSQAEKYPQEYGPLVEQYLKNLSDQAGSR